MLSFIIPARNAGETIRDAAESILGPYPDAELIIAENGSTDRTNEVLSALAAEHGNIRVLHTEAGVSAARNAGLRTATGEWIAFVDADDLWTGSREETDRLLAGAGEADLVVCGYTKGGETVTHRGIPTERTLRGEETAQVRAWMMTRPTLRMSVWAKLFRRRFLETNGLAFDPSLSHSEDAEFLIRCMNRAPAVRITQTAVYRHYTGCGSVTRSRDPGRTAAYLRSLEAVRGELQGENAPPRHACAAYVAAHLYLIAVHDIFDGGTRRPWRGRIRDLRAVLAHDIIRGTVSGLRLADLSDPMLIPAWLFGRGLLSCGGLICRLRAVQNGRRSRRDRARGNPKTP